jgi:hypothetical protein
MGMNRLPFVVTGANAAIMDAGMKVPRYRPDSMRINPHQVIYYDEAPEELKNDPTVWWTRWNGRKQTIKKLTDEEKEDLRLDKEWRLMEMFNYILNHYGWQTADFFYNKSSWKEKFDEAEIVPDLIIPHCKYCADGQCDMSCLFFTGKCAYPWSMAD